MNRPDSSVRADLVKAAVQIDRIHVGVTDTVKMYRHKPRVQTAKLCYHLCVDLVADSAEINAKAAALADSSSQLADVTDSGILGCSLYHDLMQSMLTRVVVDMDLAGPTATTVCTLANELGR